MISLLNRFAWVISLTLAMIPMLIDDDLFFFSLMILFFTKFIVLSKTSIEYAVKSIASQNIQSDSMVSSDITPVQSLIQDEGYDSYNPIETDERMKDEPSSVSHLNIATIEESAGSIPSSDPEPTISYEPPQPSQFSIWLHDFFSDRPLAKIGGILLFLGALFFLGLIFINIGPIGRVLMGIIFGFSLIGTGIWLDKKGILTESRVLFGIGISINYLTILFGRYLISGSDAFIGDGLATIMLLLNTGFAIVLALMYHSRVLLGFSFIFAYLIPFLVGSHASDTYLLSIYTTIVTVAIVIILGIRSGSAQLESANYLEGIAVIGMTSLFSLATFNTSVSLEVIFIFSGLLCSVLAFSRYAYTAKISPIPIFIGAYIILFLSTFSISEFVILPVFLIIFLFVSLIMTSNMLLGGMVFGVFGGISFVIALMGFWMTGSASLVMLLMLGIIFFSFFGVVILQAGSILLASIGIGSFGLLTLLGFSSADSLVLMDPTTIILVKSMSTILLVGVSIFTMRLKDARIFLMGIIMSGIMVLYPNSFRDSALLSIVVSLMYLLCSLLIPYLLATSKSHGLYHSFLLASLPVSTLVVSTAVYQFGQDRFSGITMGLLYIIEAIIYLMYAFMAGKDLILQANNTLSTSTIENKSTILVLFAIPLSLFTFSLAFIFRDVPSMMSLAWVIESAILYLVATRMQDDRVFFAGHGVLAIGIIKEFTLLSIISQGDWINIGILILMGISIFSSLYVLRGENLERRTPYDILHIIAIIIIGIGVSRIVPSTGTGWSIFGPASFLVILSIMYGQIGKRVHHIFLNILLGGLCLVFISKFDGLNKMEIVPILVQFSALLLIYLVGYIEYQSKKSYGIIGLSISLLATLIISSMYVNEFFLIFSVSIYLAIIATILIIRGITYDNARLRTIGLYIGIFVLLKILGYDIWVSGGNLVIRVVALMVTGGLMIYLSQLYGRYVSRSWSDELSFSNILTGFPSEEKIEEKSVIKTTENPESVVEIDPFVGELQNEVHHVSVSEVAGVIFTSNSGEKFTIKRVSIMRLARYICTRLNKTTFAPHELDAAYTYVMGNLASTLPKAQLDILLTQLKLWISVGGSVEFILKDKQK